MFTKSGLMVGPAGEEAAEIYQVMDDLRTAKVDFLTIGQYLRHHPVLRYVAPNEFQEYEKNGSGQIFFNGFGLPPYAIFLPCGG